MTTTLYALPEAGPGQETVYQNGRKVVVSQKTGSLVLMTPATTTFSSDDDNAFFRVLARNDSRERHDFSLDNIRATDNGGTLRLWTHEALVAKAERDSLRAAAAMIFAGGLQA